MERLRLANLVSSTKLKFCKTLQHFLKQKLWPCIRNKLTKIGSTIEKGSVNLVWKCMEVFFIPTTWLHNHAMS
jgi:hypothetical protein